jgi:hypothetical protein
MKLPIDLPIDGENDLQKLGPVDAPPESGPAEVP